MKNHDIAAIFRSLSVFLDMDGIPFKPRAYEKAADAIDATQEDVEERYAQKGLQGLEDIPGVGQHIAEKIVEFLKTGKISAYEKLRKKYPVNISELRSVAGLGPKKIKELYRRLDIRSLTDLEKALKQKKLRTLPGFGLTTETTLSHALAYLKTDTKRAILGLVLPDIEKIQNQLERVSGVRQVTVCGSTRRMQETIGDIDIVLDTSEPKNAVHAVTTLDATQKVLAQGPTKITVRLQNGLHLDVRVIPPESYGAAVQYFTGDKAHNIKVRERAAKKKLKLNEYGLFRGSTRIAGKTEVGIYKALGMGWIPPEMRTDNREIEQALKGSVPKLLEYDDLKGDLQVQTNWTDGAHSIEEMARAAKEAGLSYIAITDHTKSLTITHGLDERRLIKQMKVIDTLNKKIRNFRILKGAEVNILQDGSLDISDNVLRRLDVVGAAVHSHFRMSRSIMTARIKRAMVNPFVDIIFHPTGRILQHREPYDVDVVALIAEAKKRRTVLEIDAFPSRLDLHDEYIRKAVDSGVRLVVDSDAHATEHFTYLRFGIGQARRGWAKKSDILNTLTVTKFIQEISSRRKYRTKM